MNYARTGWFLGGLAVLAGLVCAWQAVSLLGAVSPLLLPAPSDAWRSLIAGMREGTLSHQFFGTLERMLLGWLIASLLGVMLGMLIGSSRTAQAYLLPMIELVRPLPASAMVPVAIGFLGLSDNMVFAVIAFGGLWPMLLSTIHGFAAVEPQLIEFSRALGLGRFSVIWKIALPNALPDIFIGLRLSLTVALVLTVIGEMLASRPGLGQWILVSGRTFRSDDLFAGVILLGALGFTSAALMAWIEHHALRWRDIR